MKITLKELSSLIKEKKRRYNDLTTYIRYNKSESVLKVEEQTSDISDKIKEASVLSQSIYDLEVIRYKENINAKITITIDGNNKEYCITELLLLLKSQKRLSDSLFDSYDEK